jgi:hypothetical protein
MSPRKETVWFNELQFPIPLYHARLHSLVFNAELGADLRIATTIKSRESIQRRGTGLTSSAKLVLLRT